jgi:hypothetical protein
MNYQQIYTQLIYRAQTENRKKGIGVYYERHHIIPRCLGGANDKTNLVLLTAREHFVAHKLLCEIYPDNSDIFFAYRMMSIMKSPDQQREYKITSYEFERIRKNFSELIQVINQIPNTKEHNKKISDALIGIPKSRSSVEKMRKALSGRKHTKEHVEKNRQAQLGRVHSEETKQKMRESKLASKNPNYGKLAWNSGITQLKTEICNFCNELFSKSGIKNHEKSCKNKKKSL